GRHLVGIELARIQPDAHGVLATEHLHAADARHAAERLDQVGGDIVGDVVPVHAAVFGNEADHHQEAGTVLVHRDALLLHDRGQAGGGQLQLVLHLHLGDVRVGAGLEGQGDRDRTVGITGGGHVVQT